MRACLPPCRTAASCLGLAPERALSTTNTTGLDTPGGINTLYQWYRHARTMAYAIAKAGNHTFKCKEKGDVLMAPLDVVQNYVEDAYVEDAYVEDDYVEDDYVEDEYVEDLLSEALTPEKPHFLESTTPHPTSAM